MTVGENKVIAVCPLCCQFHNGGVAVCIVGVEVDCDSVVVLINYYMVACMGVAIACQVAAVAL